MDDPEFEILFALPEPMKPAAFEALLVGGLMLGRTTICIYHRIEVTPLFTDEWIADFEIEALLGTAYKRTRARREIIRAIGTHYYFDGP